MDAPDFKTFVAQLASLLKADASRISRATTANDVDGWDSVRHANVILSLEDAYNIQFSDTEIQNAQDVGALYDRLIEHVKVGR